MGKTTESRHILRLSQNKIVLDIQKNPHFHDQLLADLNNKKHLIHSLCTNEPIKRLQAFLKQQLKSEVTLLQTFFNQEEGKQTVTQKQKSQCDTRLKKLLDIIKLLYKNDDFYNDDDKNLPLFNKIMTITDDFEVITKLISLLMNTSFQKTQKEFFYHIYFLCDHVDIYDLKDSGISQVYQIGKKIREFKFFFIQKNQQKKIVIDDFFIFVWQNNLNDSHYRKVTDFILQTFQILMEKGSMTHLALLTKVKLYLKGVKFNNDGTLTNNGDAIVQAVAYSNAMYCYVEYFVLGQEITQHCSIPNIFSFPPAYSEIFKELLEIFLLEGSHKQTHLTIMKCINQILELQEKTSAVDIVGRLNDNSSLIYKYLNYAKNYMQSNQTNTPIAVKGVNFEAFSTNEFISQLFKIMHTQVQQTHELNSIACWIVEKIFKKETLFTYNQEVITEAGNLLVSIEYEEEKLMKLIIQKVQKNPEQSKPYLRVLNDLFSKKYHRMIQRRDLTYIARESSESCILVKMEQLIRKETEKGVSERDSFFMETIQLVSSICEQSPTLLDSIQKTSSTLIPYLLELVSAAIHVPTDINSLTDVINFLHHISLKDGPIRNKLLQKPMTTFIIRFLTMDRFVETLSRNVKSIGGYIVGSINRFIGNIKNSSKYIFNAFIQAAFLINMEYKHFSLSTEIKNYDLTLQNSSIEQRVQIENSKMLSILRCDSKLINLLKIIEKTSSMILKKFKSRSLYMLLRPLLEINFQRDNVFLDGSLELSLLKAIINETITAIKNYNELTQKKERRKLNRLSSGQQILARIQQQENESGEPSQQGQPIQLEQNAVNQRLATQNSQIPQQNQNPQQSEANNQQQPPNQPLVNSSASEELFNRYIIQQDDNSGIQYEQIEESNIQPQQKENQMQDQNKQNSFAEQQKFYTELTQKMTKELLQNHETMSEQLIENLYLCFENLDKLIIPILQDQVKKQAVIKQMTQYSIFEEVEKQSIQAIMKNQPQVKSFSFNAVNLSITIYSSKLQRLFKFMQFSLNMDNENFNHAEFQNVIQKFDKYLRFYLEMVAESNSKNIFEFMQNQEVKYLQTSKLPRSRVQTKTIDIENLKRNLQNQLNERWTLFNVLYDSFLRLISGSLNGSNGKAFIILPEFQTYFKMIKQTLLENIQDYLLTKILPILKTNIGVRDFQRYRQSIKVVMQIFALNELKSSLQKGKSDSNTLIIFYLHSFDPLKQNILTTLSKLLAEQQQKNEEEEGLMLEDTPQNRWRQVKRVFLKMNYYKIKSFIHQAYYDDPQQQENLLNQSDHPDYERQLSKSYFVYSRINELLCTFLENVIFSQRKNGYLRDFLLFTTSQFASFSKRIINHPQTIFVNFIFPDDEQKELTEAEFYSKINQRNSKMLNLILNNLDSSVLYYLTMILKAILTVQRPRDQKLLGKYNQKIKQMFYDVSKSINQVYFNFTGRNMSLDFQLPRKSSILGQKLSKTENGQIKMEEQKQQDLDLRRQVLKVNNLFTMIIEFIKNFKTNNFFEEGHPKISINYVKSMVEFGTFILSNFEVETHFPQQGDQLVISIIRMVEEFNSYRKLKEQFIKNKKTQRQKQRHSRNKKKFKHLKKRGKQFDKESVSNSNQLEDFSASQNIPPKKTKRQNKKSNRDEKKSTKSAFKPSKRQKSEISSKQGKQITKDKKSKTKDQQNNSIQNEVSLKGSILNRSMTDFLKICLTASQSKPYLTARTTQLIINFVQKFSKDVIIRTESDIQNIKNGKKLEKFKNKFFVFGSQIFGDLLQVKLKNQKLQGFFYLVTYLGMKLMTQPHVKIDFQCAIKRIFYEQQIKAENNGMSSPKLITLKDFERYLEKTRIKDYSQFSYLLCFVQRKSQENNKDLRALMEKYIQKSTIFKKDKVNNVFNCALCLKKFSSCDFLAKHVILKHPELKQRLNFKSSQNQIKFTEQIHEFTNKNFKKFTNSLEDSQIFVKLKNPQELDVIGLPSIKRKKPAHNQDLNKKVRFYEYHPQGDFAALVCQIINNIVKIILNQIIQTLDTERKNEEDLFLKPFNLKILLYSLQIFCRQSPTIVPWIARFKCKKILLTELKRQKLTPQSLAYRKIVTYVYGSEEILLQNFQQVSFLTLLIKLIYPVSQISTFIFELCLDNNVLMKEKSDKVKEVKEQNQNQIRKCIPFGSIIRQKIVWELQNELSINKNMDQNFLRNGAHQKQKCLMMKKVGSMGLITILMSIREFAKLCIESNLMRKIQDEYLRTSKIVRQLCGNKNGEELPLSSNIMRNFLINYFLRPMQMLQQLSIQYQIAKRQNATFKRMWTNGDRVHIRYLLTSQSINDQLFGDEIFFKSNFKSTWFYANNLQGDEPLDFEDHFDERDSMDEDSSDNDSNGFWDQEESVPLVDQEIEQEEQERSVSMSGEQLVSDQQGDEAPQEWYGSEDPFDRQSNTFENFILYPDDDYVLENGQQQDEGEEMQQQQEDDDMDIEDEDQLDSYDDSQDEGLEQGLQIDLSSGDDNMLFPIDEDQASAMELFNQPQSQFYSEDSNIVPEIGIYRYYIPDEPQRRDHANHQCNNANKAEIKLIQTLYQIFMDVVSFEDIKITNKMVKLENQQAKLIRKVFKVAAFRVYQQKLLKNPQNKRPLHNLHILQLQNQYYEQLYQIFTIDSIFLVSEQVDFKHCERVTYFLQSFPIHYTDMYMSEPQAYFNEFTKALRRRRGMFMNSSMMERMRRAQNFPFQNTFGPFRQIRSIPRTGVVRRPSRFVPRTDLLRIVPQSAEDIQNPNEQNQSEQSPILPVPQSQQNQQMHLIEFNVENPNGGVINVSTNLAQILQNMGMSERQFFSLPNDAQSDIIQNSLQSQLQNGEGNLNQYLGRIFGNDHLDAPNVSPIMQPHPLGENEQNIEQANQLNEQSQQIEMPQEFDMEEQNVNEEQHGQMQEEGQNQDTPINSINNDQNEEINPGNDALPERYREISLKHSQKLSKDIIETLNKDHKNYSKFPQISEQLLEQILETIFVLENKDFSRFPESFLTLNMINSKSCSKVLSSLMNLLSLYPGDSYLNQMIEDRDYGVDLIQSKKQKNDLIPKLSLRTYLYEISKDYENEIYPNIAIKILHILETITNNYSISMQMLNTNNNPLKVLERYSFTQTKEEIYLSSFQTLIRLLNSKTIKKSPIMVDQILKITNNIVKHYFQKNIFSIHQQHKQLKGSKKNIPVENANKIEPQGNQQISILPVSMEKEQTASKQIHKAIELSQISIELLCSLLMSDDLSQTKNLSELIMKLSINGKNLILFLKNIESILQKLCQKSIIFLNKQKKQMEEQGKANNFNTSVEESELDDLKKFFCLLEIFSSMIKEFKQFAYRHHIDRYDFIMEKFKGIIESKSLFKLCQTIASIISTTGQDNDLISNSTQIFEIFFAVFSINIELSTKVTQQDKNLAQEKESNRIASLGEINERQVGQGIKSEHMIDYTSQSLIQNVAFYKLWNDKVCSPNGRILLNSMIKKKLFTSLKRRKQFSSMSLFEIPMVKIILNTPHLLDFENKRALFRAEMKRLKKKFGTENVIYMSLDRKEVFQQSFNIIMDKKPQQLKNRVKIDFEGQEGQDAGGLTREWYQLLSTQIFNPNYGLFRPSSTGTTYQPSSTSYVNSEHLNYFKFIGRIMGKALFDGFMLDAYFTPAFYKHILKIPITYLDMEQQDYQYFNSLKWILNNSPIEDYMDLDFTYEFDNFGEIKTKQLIPNGANVQVTEENKWKYVQLICYAKMATAVQAQLQKFLEGLHEIVPHKYLRIFDPKELQMMISGLPTIDINDLKRNTILNNYQKTDQIIIWLFEVLESFDMSLRTSFLQFVTGTSKVPPQGFKGLMGLNGPTKFTIQKQFDIKKLPRAHTCFNQLDLPTYPTKEMLIQKLTYAITQGKQGFGIV